MTLSYSREAKERIRSLPPEIKRGIKEILDTLREDPYLGKPLRRELTGFWSARFRYYRIIYQWAPDQKIVKIFTVGRRERVYEDFFKTGQYRP